MNIDKSVIAKALQPRSRPTKESFPELNDVLQALRIVAGLAVGIMCGMGAATGWVGFTLYGLGAVVGCYVYYTTYLEADIESYGSQALLMEGLQAGLAVMLLLWTIFYQFTGGKA